MSETTPQINQDEKIKPEETLPHINIKVVNADGAEVFFKIKPSTTLKKLMEAFCQRLGLQFTSVRFSFDGNRISPEHTAAQLGMEEGDVIDAMVEQTGGK